MGQGSQVRSLQIERAPKGGKWTYVSCVKSGKYRNTRGITEADRQRQNSTAKTNCPFSLRFKQNPSGNWTLTVLKGTHNHEPFSSNLTHAIQRRIDVATGDQIMELTRHNNKPSQIVSLLAQRDEPVAVTAKDISNFIAKHNRKFLHVRAPVEALLEWLQQQECPHQAKTTSVSKGVDRLTGLFFAHPVGLFLLQRFCSVTVIDGTYNTNQHRLPLLHFIGMTSSNKSFTIALAFLPEETTITYTWALQALQRAAPDWKPDVVVTDDDAALGAALINTMQHPFANIHCQWHVRKNVEKEARSRLPDDDEYEQFMSDFDELRDARTFEELTTARDHLAAAWADRRQDLVNYIDLKLSSEHLWVSAYVDRHPHMGTRVTSRAEGAHATLKQYLYSRHGNLYNVAKALLNHFVVQQRGIEMELAADMDKIPIVLLEDRAYIELTTHVSRHALRIIKTQDEIAARNIEMVKRGKDIPPCACILAVTHGLPCCHHLAEWKALGQPFPLSAIHPQWRTATGLADTRRSRLLDPLDPNQRKLAVEETKTGRLLTTAELAHAKHKKAVRRCRNCHQQGHNCNKFPEPCGRCASKGHSLNQCTL